jgi:hypothetical protein
MKIMKLAIYLLLTILVTNSYSQSKFYTSLASGCSFHSFINKEDSKTTDFVLHQKPYETKKYKFSVPLQLQLGYLFSKHFGLEISPSICYITTSWWSYRINNGNYNRQIALNNYIFPLSFLYSNNISKKINFRAQVGGFINYVPKYTDESGYSNLNGGLWHEGSFDESFTTLTGYSIVQTASSKPFVIRYKLNQPLITKIQFGYTGALQVGYDISPTVNIFFQVQAFKTITDLENKKDITMTRTYENGTQDVIKFNYYSNMYKQFFTREPNDLNNRPKSTVAILNTVLGIRYNFREKKDNTFRIE